MSPLVVGQHAIGTGIEAPFPRRLIPGCFETGSAAHPPGSGASSFGHQSLTLRLDHAAFKLYRLNAA